VSFDTIDHVADPNSLTTGKEHDSVVAIPHDNASDESTSDYDDMFALQLHQTPPPPPPPLSHPSTSQSKPIPGFRQELLESIEDKQDDIRDARERLVGIRVRLRRKRLEVRATREEVGVKVGFAVDHIKRFLLSQGLELPRDLQEALNEADASRDKLGIQESEFEEAEERHNLEEWIYTDKETRFVQDLYAHHSAGGVATESALVYTGQPGDVQPTFAFDDARESLHASETSSTSIVLAAQNEFRSLEPHSEQPSAPFSTGPIEYLPTSKSLVYEEADSGRWAISSKKPQSEQDLSSARLGWTQTRGRIDEWLLEALRESTFQRAQLRNILPTDTSVRKDWLKLVIRHWNAASPTLSAFHTGDTTMSGSLSSGPISAKTMQKPFEESPFLDVGEGPSSATPLVEGDHNVDALEDIDFPSDIKLCEIFDRPSKRVTFDDRSFSALSISTQTTIMTHASSENVPSSVSSCNELRTGSSTLQHEHEPVATVQNLEPAHLRALSGEGSAALMIASFGILPQAVQDISQDSMPSMVRTDDSSRTSDTAFQLVVDEAPTPRNKYAEPPSDDLPILSLTEPPVHNTYKNRVDVSGHTSELWAARSRTRHPFAPFIRVKTTRPWSLPLLRLTPFPVPTFADPSKSHRCMHLKTIPFVSISDTPARLPGPSGAWGSPTADLYS
jgi:hypothetical protein